MSCVPVLFAKFWLLPAALVLAACASSNDPPTSQAPDTQDGSSAASGGTDNGGSGATVVPPPGPTCDLAPTHAGEEITAGMTCTERDPELCWRPCGPEGLGWKSETCAEGTYVEGDCLFPGESPGADLSCYQHDPSAELHPDCPTSADMMPRAGAECSVPECTACNVNLQYLAADGSIKVGYCFCEPDAGGETRTWLCASAAAWPPHD